MNALIQQQNETARLALIQFAKLARLVADRADYDMGSLALSDTQVLYEESKDIHATFQKYLPFVGMLTTPKFHTDYVALGIRYEALIAKLDNLRRK
jgi:hypothetical protein